MNADETPSQTAGPYLHIGLLPQGLAPLTSAVTAPALTLEGQVLDGAGEPLRDALVELWDASTGQWLRSATDADSGLYRFELGRPGVAFVHLFIVARGINRGLHTRAYLDAAPGDALLASLGERAATLRAGGEGGRRRFDVRLQGENETVFLQPRSAAADGHRPGAD